VELTSRYMSFQMFFPGEALPTVRAKEHLRTGVCVATGLAKYTRSHELNASSVVDLRKLRRDRKLFYYNAGRWGEKRFMNEDRIREGQILVSFL
jgi:hypothetical protein